MHEFIHTRKRQHVSNLRGQTSTETGTLMRHETFFLLYSSELFLLLYSFILSLFFFLSFLFPSSFYSVSSDPTSLYSSLFSSELFLFIILSVFGDPNSILTNSLTVPWSGNNLGFKHLMLFHVFIKLCSNFLFIPQWSQLYLF